MTEKIDKFTESLRVNLNRIADRLHSVGEDLTEVGPKDSNSLETKLLTARQNLVNAKLALKGAEEKAQAWFKAQQHSGTDVIQGWKDKVDRHRMARHAELAEDNATSANLLAEAAVIGAAVAAYEAVTARRAADALPKA